MGVWLTGIIILLIVGILLDGWRRMRQNRQNNLKIPRTINYSQAPEDDYPSELPNGGARVVSSRRTEPQERTEPKIGTEADWDVEDETAQPEPEALTTQFGMPAEPQPEHPFPNEPEPELETEPEPRIPQQVALNLDESVPMLMESVEREAQEEGGDQASEPVRSEPEPVASSKKAPAQFSGQPSAQSPEQSPAPTRTAAPSMREPAPEVDVPVPEEVLVINVMAPAGTYFQGDALQASIFDQGLRYGSMNIFHRYRDARGGGPVQFSLANMIKPGTFDLDAMDSFETPGVSLFMTLPLEGDNVAAFDLMLATAKTLAETLGGELKDENRSVMTRQTMEHDRQRVLDFVRRQLSRVPG